MTAASRDPVSSLRKTAAAALDAAAAANRAHNYEAAMSAACTAVDAMIAIARAERSGPAGGAG